MVDEDDQGGVSAITFTTIMPGKFIVFEGLDRSGKSTQVDVLVKRLESEGRQVILRKFPGGLEWHA